MSGRLLLDPGALATELTLETCTPVSDGMGGHAEEWNAIATLFARVEPLAARSRPGAGQTIETVTHRIIMRHRAGILAGMRFVRPGRVFEIVTVHDPDGTGRYLACGTREVTT